jgi:outer membrane protein
VNADKLRSVASALMGFALIASVSTPACAELQDLAAIYRAVRERDPSLAVARSQVAVADEKVVQARAALLPTVTLNLSANRQVGEAAFNGAAYADRAVRGSATTLQLTQPLWRPGTWASYAQAELQQRQAEQGLRQAEMDLMLRTSQSYFDALIAQENAVVADNQVEAVAQQLTLARRNFEAGLTTVTDVHEAQARLALAQAQRSGAQTERANRLADLERLLGARAPELAGLLTDAQSPALDPPDVQAWIDLANADNPQLLAQELGVAMASREISKLAQAHGPTLEATLGYGRNTSTGSMTSPTELASRSRAAQVGVQLVIPLYSGGATQSRVREAMALQEKAQAELEATRGQLMAQVRQAYTAVVNGQAQIVSLAVAASANQAAVNANKMGYRIGTRINIDVLNAQQQQFGTERDLYKVRAETIVQALRLKAAAGSLRDSDLHAVGTLLKGEP